MLKYALRKWRRLVCGVRVLAMAVPLSVALVIRSATIPSVLIVMTSGGGRTVARQDTSQPRSSSSPNTRHLHMAAPVLQGEQVPRCTHYNGDTAAAVVTPGHTASCMSSAGHSTSAAWRSERGRRDVSRLITQIPMTEVSIYAPPHRCQRHVPCDVGVAEARG